ncbi:MAG: hypothetical protein Kow0059_18300 [Candidatus Sumerlaeia bacterium]
MNSAHCTSFTTSGHADATPLTPAREAGRAAALLGLGVAAPWLCHFVTIGHTPLGVVLLPLFLPVALAALVLPARSAFTVALALPLLSLLVSGMPPLHGGTVFVVMAEGAVMAAAMQWAKRWGASWQLAFAAGAAANRAAALILATALALAARQARIEAALMPVAYGTLGLLVHLALLPVLLKLFGYRGVR